jgi:hypothetical protein
MIMRRILCGIGWLTQGAVLPFFLAGLADGGIRARTMPHWAGPIALGAVALLASVVLRRRGRMSAAIVLAAIVALPAIAGVAIAGFIVVLFIIKG